DARRADARVSSDSRLNMVAAAPRRLHDRSGVAGAFAAAGGAALALALLDRILLASTGVAGSGSMRATLCIVALDLALIVPLGRGVGAAAAAVLPQKRPLAPSRILFGLIVAAALVPLAFSLARGHGVGRLGLGRLVRAGIPCAAGIAAVALAHAAAALARA